MDIQSLPCALLRFDENGRLLDRNPAAAKLHEGFLQDAETITLELLTGDSLGALEKFKQLAIGETFRCINNVTTTSAGGNWLLSEFGLAKDADGSNRVLALQLDVSDLKEKELALENREARSLEQLQTLQRKLVQTVGDNDLLKDYLQDTSFVVARLAKQIRDLGQRPLLETDWHQKLETSLAEWCHDCVEETDSLVLDFDGGVPTGIVSFLAGAMECRNEHSSFSRCPDVSHSPRSSIEFPAISPRGSIDQASFTRLARPSLDRGVRELQTLNSMKRTSQRRLSELPTVAEGEHGLQSHALTLFPIEEDVDVSSGDLGGLGPECYLSALDARDAAVAKAEMLQAQLSDLQSRHTQLQAQYSSLSTEHSALVAAKESLKMDATHWRHTAEAQQAKSNGLEATVTQLRKELEAQKVQYKEAHTEAVHWKQAHQDQQAHADGLKQAYDRLDMGAAELKQAYDKLDTGATELKQAYDKLDGDALQLQQAYEEQKAQCDLLEDNANEIKAAYDCQKSQYDELQKAATEMKAGLDKASEDATELKSKFDTLVDETQATKDKLLNDTAEKEAELEKHKRELEEQRSVAANLMQERLTLLRKQEALQVELQLAMANYQPKNSIDQGTPADRILLMMSELLEGVIPSIEDILLVQTSILENSDIYKPPNLEQQLQNSSLDSDVTQLLGRQLGIQSSASSAPANVMSLEDLCNNRASVSRNSSKLRLDLAHGLAGDEDYSSLEHAVHNLMGLPPLDSLEPEKALGEGDSNGPLAVRAWRAQLRRSGGYEVAPDQLPTPRMLFEQTEVVLQTVDEWQFDAFRLAEVTNDHPLSVLSFFLFSQRDLMKKYSIDPAAFARYARVIEDGYRRNPYHNAKHAADVLQTVHVLMHHGGLVPGYADSFTVMAVYFAAMVHDFEHGGLTNDYLINTSQDLAIVYNDKAPQENHHLAAAFQLLRKPEYNFLAGMKKADMDKFRKTVIDLVLATDMKQHFTIVSQFGTVHRLGTTSSATSSEVGRMSHDNTSQRSNGSKDGACESDKILLPLDENERLLSLQVALKCADLGHVAAALEVHKLWVQRLEDEFFLQGDRERDLKMPISPLFDRHKQGITKSQVGFFEIVVIPLYSAFSRIFINSKPMLRNVMRNYNYWVELERGTAAANRQS